MFDFKLFKNAEESAGDVSSKLDALTQGAAPEGEPAPTPPGGAEMAAPALPDAPPEEEIDPVGRLRKKLDALLDAEEDSGRENEDAVLEDESEDIVEAPVEEIEEL